MCYGAFHTEKIPSRAGSDGFGGGGGLEPEMISTSSEQKIFDDVINSLREKNLKKSADRIAKLLKLTEDDLEEGEGRLSAVSTQCFVEFLMEFRDLGEPLLGFFGEGILSAEWRIAEDKHLLVEFPGRDAVSFIVIKPDDTAENGKLVLNGRCAWKRAIEIFREHGVGEWLT